MLRPMSAQSQILELFERWELESEKTKPVSPSGASRCFSSRSLPAKAPPCAVEESLFDLSRSRSLVRDDLQPFTAVETTSQSQSPHHPASPPAASRSPSRVPQFPHPPETQTVAYCTATADAAAAPIHFPAPRTIRTHTPRATPENKSADRIPCASATAESAASADRSAQTTPAAAADTTCNRASR